MKKHFVVLLSISIFFPSVLFAFVKNIENIPGYDGSSFGANVGGNDYIDFLDYLSKCDNDCLKELCERVSCPINSSYYDYSVSGYGDTGYVTGSISSYSDGDVDGYLNLDDGSEVYFEGEFTGHGEIEGYDENGYYYSLEVD